MALDPNDPLVAKALKAERLKRARIASEKLFQKVPHQTTPEQREFFLSRCHAKQRAFLEDASPLKALVCPRRTGKTTVTLFSTFLADLKFPGSTIAYVVPDSRAHARRLFWKPMHEMNDKLKLGLYFNEVEKRVKTPRGTDIILLAAHDHDSPAALRGDAYSLVVLDEAKDFGPHFEELILEAVLPGIDDYGGEIVMGGTPGDVLMGYFHDVTTGVTPGWSIHRWTKADNTFLRPEARDLERIASQYQSTKFPSGWDNPRFRREQLAEWVGNDDERVYQYDPSINNWDGVLPEGHKWLYTMGIDLGERDDNAFVVGAFSSTCPNMYIVDQYSRSHMEIRELAEKIHELCRKWPNMVAMVADTGGYGRGIVTELQGRTYNLPITSAKEGVKETDKPGFMALMNSDFASGRIKCSRDTKLASEWLRLYRRISPKTHRVDYGHSDLGDAALYMWKESQHWASQEVAPQPKVGTKEYWQKEEDRAITEAAKAVTTAFWDKAVSDY